MTQEKNILNISCYKFIELHKLDELKLLIKNTALSLNLKGTILISHEGINMFVAGNYADVYSLVKFIATETKVGKLEPKESFTEYQPFHRMLVRIKKEIISMGVPEVNPGIHPGPRVSAKELKKWLDNGKDVVILDTRNEYEVRLGTFKNAVHLNINTFREFPEAVRSLENLKDKTIVSFCTGGIRCEKSTPLMQKYGFKDIYQLDGGILKYFEEVGGDHWQGECFVFDQRVGVDPNLQETATDQCFACRNPLSPKEMQSALYKAKTHCPYCYSINGLTNIKHSDTNHSSNTDNRG